MNTPNNRRSQNTQEALIRAAFETMLMEGKPVSRVTVREICEKAQVNRSTFYSHYTDIYDLFEKVERQMALNAGDGILSNLEQGDMRSALEGVLSYMYKYRDFYLLYFMELNRVTAMIQLMIQPFQEKIEALKERDLGFGVQDEASYHFEFFTAGFTALVRHWLLEGCKETPGQLYEILARQYSEESLFRGFLQEG